MRKHAIALPSIIFSITFGWYVPVAADVELEEIIVTAQKREQNQQDVPIAVSAYSGQMLQDSGIKDVFDLQASTPGLVVDHNQSTTSSSFSIRGIGTGTQNFGLESSVGIYIDGVYRSRQSAAINDLIDVDVIEVLRGPQGTLFGRNTPAGAILINTTQPDHENTGFIDLTAGNLGLAKYSGAYSFSAIDDVLAFRITGFGTERDGYIDNISTGENNVLNDRDRWGYRLQALYTPVDNLYIRVIADRSRIEEKCCGTTVLLDNNLLDQRPASADPTVTDLFPFGTDKYVIDAGGTFISTNQQYDHIVAYDQMPASSNTDSGFSVQVDWDLENYTLTSVSAWREFNSLDIIDSDFTDLDILTVSNDSKQDSFSQELRIAGNHKKLNYVAGAYYFSQDLKNVQTLSTGEHTGLIGGIASNIDVVALEPALGVAFPADGSASNDSKQDHESWAFFGQADYAITDTLTITTGLRHTEEEKQLDEVFTEENSAYGFNEFTLLAPRDPQDESLDEENTSGTIKLSWDATDNILFYTSYGKGYKSGGTNTDRIPEIFEATFDAEISKSFEVGMKSTFPDQAIRLNIAIHKTDVSNLQVNTFNGTGFNLQNAGSVDSHGAEIELFWKPSETLTISTGYAYSIVEYDEFLQGNCWTATPFRGTADPGAGNISEPLLPVFCDRSGDRLGNNPEHYLTSSIRKEHYIADSILSFISGEMTHYSDQVMEASNDPFETQGGYTLFNMRIGFILEEDDVELALWARNLTDKEYYGTNFDPPLQEGKLLAYQREPRTFGLTARKNF